MISAKEASEISNNFRKQKLQNYVDSSLITIYEKIKNNAAAGLKSLSFRLDYTGGLFTTKEAYNALSNHLTNAENEYKTSYDSDRDSTYDYMIISWK